MKVVSAWRVWLNRLSANRRSQLSARRRRVELSRVESLESREMLTSSISGVVFDDVNGDKIKQADENVISGAIVFVDSDGDGILDPENIPDGAATEPFATTAADGTYTIAGLPAAVTHLHVRIPGLPQDVTRDVTVDGTNSKIDVNLAISRGTVAGIAFDDANQDGTRQAGEPAHAGVTIFVDSNDNGSPDSNEPQAVTSADGNYTLMPVKPGSVHIRAVSPSGFLANPRNATLAAGATLAAQNVALEAQTGTVSGFVFVDGNGNGQKDGVAEAGKSNVTVFLDLNNDGTFNGTDRATITDVDGKYTFSQVLPASFQIHVVPPNGFSNPMLTVTLSPGQTLGDQNLALQVQAGTISGVVFRDTDRNNVQNGAETGVANVAVFLDLDHNGLFSTGDLATLTGANGAYSFLQVVPGNIHALVIPPAGMTTTPLDLSLAAGQTISTANFALQGQTGNISGIVFNDADHNGILNGSEAGFTEPVKVFLDLNNSKTLDVGDLSVDTDPATGIYLFSNVTITPGTPLHVRAIPPAHYTVTPLDLNLAAGQTITTANVILQQVKLQLSQTPVTYTTGTPAVQVTSNTFVSGLVAEPTDHPVLNIKIIGRKKKDQLQLAPSVGSQLTVDAVDGGILFGTERVGKITTAIPGVAIAVTFDAGKFSPEALREILDSVRFSTPRKRAGNTATIQVQLQLGSETLESTRKLQIVSRRK